MQIKISESGHVIGYTMSGTINDGIDFDGNLPEGFHEDCRTYKLVDSQLIFDVAKKQELDNAERATEIKIQLEEAVQRRMRELALAQPSEEMMELQMQLEELEG